MTESVGERCMLNECRLGRGERRACTEERQHLLADAVRFFEVREAREDQRVGADTYEVV